MSVVILGLLAETSVHPGSGRSIGTVDLPVSREGATDLPVIFGSAVKGAFRDKARQEWGEGEDLNRCFGQQESAGNLVFSDARLLLLPVRSLSGRYRWATSCLLLERYWRDLARAGRQADFTVPQVAKGEIMGQLLGEDMVFLEERQFRIVKPVEEDILHALKSLFLHQDAANRLQDQLVVMNDDDFSWYARYGLPVNAHNALDDETKTTKKGALWFEETLPPDTLFYIVAAGRNSNGENHVDRLFEKTPYVQMGGNETTGQGWFAVTLMR